MIVVTGTFRIAEASREKAAGIATTMARATREEPGCITYGFFEDIETPGLFRIYEEWKDEAALASHFEQPHMAAFGEAMADVEVLSVETKKFEAGPAGPVRGQERHPR